MISIHDLPPDPDRDDVPAQWLDLEHKQITMIEPDGTRTTGTVVIVPALFAESRRIRERHAGGDDAA